MEEETYQEEVTETPVKKTRAKKVPEPVEEAEIINEDNIETMTSGESVTVGTGSGNYNGADAGIAALSALAMKGGGEGYSYDPMGCAVLLGQADIRSEVRDVEADIKDAIVMSNSQRQAAELNLHNRICEVEKAAIDAKYQTQLEIKASEQRLGDKVDECCKETTTKLTAFEKSVDEKFCDLREEMKESFTELERRELKREMDVLRDANSALKTEKDQTAQTAAIIAAITSSHPAK